MRSVYLVAKHGITSSIGKCELVLPVDVLGSVLEGVAPHTPIFSFQSLAGVQSEFLSYDSSTRLSLNGASEAVCIAIQCASSFGDLVLWDLAHELPVGGRIVVLEPVAFADCILHKRYFDGVFESVTDRSGQWFRTTWSKVSETLSERDRGLTDWTFGLPVGEATLPLIKRIAADVDALGLAGAEILFAVSKPLSAAAQSALPKNVRVLVCGNATITQKKNLIAASAVYPNLCIFHDRVVLPICFKQAVEVFGDFYGLSGFQQLFFDSRRESLERYSDYHVELGDANDLIDADGEDERGRLYIDALETRLGYRARFIEGHPAEYSRKSYFTGSLYLAKRSIWNLVQQNDRIEWNELEDVEFGLHAMHEYGIPARINPHAFAFTSRARGILIGDHETVNRHDGAGIVHITNEYVGDGSSLTGLDQTHVRALAWKCFETFGLAESDYTMRAHIFYAPMESSQEYAKYWITILYRLVVPRRRKRIESMLAMFATAAFGSDYDRSMKRYITNRICGGNSFIDEIVGNDYFMRALANAPSLIRRRSDKLDDIFQAQIMRLWRRGGDYIYPYESFAALNDRIWSSIGQLDRLTVQPQ